MVEIYGIRNKPLFYQLFTLDFEILFPDFFTPECAEMNVNVFIVLILPSRRVATSCTPTPRYTDKNPNTIAHTNTLRVDLTIHLHFEHVQNYR